MTVDLKAEKPFTMMPGFSVNDQMAKHWLRQVTIKLRREIAWLWYEQGVLPEGRPDTLPPFKDKAPAVLNMQRFWKKKQEFFRTDPTAKYLSELLEEPIDYTGSVARGSFSWIIEELELNDIEAFTLALGLISVLDNSIGAVIAACHNDANKIQPTLALAQRLWDYPEQVMGVADPAHPLFHYGLLQSPTMLQEHRIDWDRPISIAPLIARQLLFPKSGAIDGFELVDNPTQVAAPPPPVAQLVASRLVKEQKRHTRLIPILGVKGAPFHDMVMRIERQIGRTALHFSEEPTLLKVKPYFDSIAVFCWLKGMDLYIDAEQLQLIIRESQRLDIELLPRLSIPVNIFIGITERQQISNCPATYLLPTVELLTFTYQERLGYWQECLQEKAAGLENIIAECARQFRFQKEAIASVTKGLKALNRTLTKDDFIMACRAETEIDMGDLAQKINPRFLDEDVILPAKEKEQYQDIVKGMRSLTKVHYEWGTERVWNESGIAVLFAGPPGTGKTMAAERLAILLDLPMYRIDLSQVASKYIGETEKNLKKLFDIADISDIILFFDEADALFGKRSEVKDAHDRYANLEISYLLERMERFKGLAILATNRKKDLDEAFLRRLRYIIDFPMPGEKERLQIWRQVIPGNVDQRNLDFAFLAKQFPLAGGHIRSIVFNACLQSAADKSTVPEGFKGELNMEEIIVALKREYEKLGRSVSLEQFGAYAPLVDKV